MYSKETLKSSSGWIILFIGIIGYVIGYFIAEQNSTMQNVAIKIGDVAIIGAVVGYLTGIAQWAGIFKRELQDIIYAKNFLGQRKDIEEIWYNVTKQMFKHKFSEIHKPLLEALRKTMPGDNDISYYEDYDANIKLEWANKEEGIVKSNEIMSFILVADSEHSFEYEIKTWTYIGQEGQPEIEAPDIFIDGERFLDIQLSQSVKEGIVCTTTKIILKGKRRYAIKYTRNKIYDISMDYFIGLKSAYLINNLCVELDLPDGIEALFIPRGTISEFECVKKSKSNIKMKYKGVVFPKQGYIFALKTN